MSKFYMKAGQPSVCSVSKPHTVWQPNLAMMITVWSNPIDCTISALLVVEISLFSFYDLALKGGWGVLRHFFFMTSAKTIFINESFKVAILGKWKKKPNYFSDFQDFK